MAKKTYYIGWYIPEEDKADFKGNVPGNLKMQYVVEQMKQTGIYPHIVSLAQRREKGFYFPQKKYLRKENLPVTYFAGFNSDGSIGKMINAFIKRIELLWMLFFVVQKTDKVVLYHSYPYTRFVAKFKKLLRFPITIEVEELYGYSATEDKPWVHHEVAAVKKMDNFICVNDGMPKSLGLRTGSFVVSYGVGRIPERTVQRRDDGKKHVVYAGTIEALKLGAITAVEAAKYLSSDYVMHIIGFGNADNINNLKRRIEEVNNEIGENRVQYDGYYSGKELDDYFFGCHIGLSSNVMRPNLAYSSFCRIILSSRYSMAQIAG